MRLFAQAFRVFSCGRAGTCMHLEWTVRANALCTRPTLLIDIDIFFIRT